MTRQELLAFMQEFHEDAEALLVAKNQDYATDADALHNLRTPEKLGLCSTATNILCHICNKVTRLVNFSRTGTLAVTEETARETCIDLSNYAGFLAAALRGESEKNSSESERKPEPS